MTVWPSRIARRKNIASITFHGSKSRLKSVLPIKRIREPVLLVETRLREHSVFLSTPLIFIQQNTIIFIWSFLVYLRKEIISRINYPSSLRLLLFLYSYYDWSSNLQTFNIASTLRLNQSLYNVLKETSVYCRIYYNTRNTLFFRCH